MNKVIACIGGDGIGPEIVAEAKKVCDKVAAKYHHNFQYKDVLMVSILIGLTMLSTTSAISSLMLTLRLTEKK
ncbi:MAG: hypothetical protein IIU45_07690 [Lachnospiraceae bacterium]|nr:hypothetical protein [Lachnospiraceae bacterium]